MHIMVQGRGQLKKVPGTLKGTLGPVLKYDEYGTPDILTVPATVFTEV